MMENKKTIMFLAYAREERRRKQSQGCIATSRNYATGINCLERFLLSKGLPDVPLGGVSSRLMMEFETWMHQRDISRNTSSCYLRALSSIWHKAVRERLVRGDPFKGTYRGIAKTRKRAVDEATIHRLHHLDIESRLTNRGRKPVGVRLRQHIDRLTLARDLFIFCFCARGLTFVDLAYLQKKDVKAGVISYSRRKTGQRIEVRIEKPMQRILDRIHTSTSYVFPIVCEEEDEQVIYRQYRCGINEYNKSLAELARMLGVQKLTSYVSRHSWATMARRSNIPIAVISQALGHDSERTTEIYLKSFDNQVVDQANKALLERFFGEK